MTGKYTLTIELGTTPTQSAVQLQKVKDAMVHAIFQKIDSTGIQDAQDSHYQVWQSIYLQAHLQRHQLFIADPPGTGGEN